MKNKKINEIKKKTTFGSYQVPLINPKNGKGELTSPEFKALILDYYLNFSESHSLHKSPRHIILSTGARGVVVIAVGNEHGDTSSNPGRY